MNKGLFFFIFCLDSLPSDSSQKRPEKKQQSGGTYKTKEQIQKAPTDDHPCNLTRTSVKISFPALKSETFVNLLGYKEPNLIYLWRCRGVCSSSSRPVACVATKTSQKTVTMAFRTHLTKQDSKELRVGKERVSSLDDDDIDDSDGDAEGGDDDGDGYVGGAGEGGGARGGCGVWLPLCGNFSKPLQRTF